MYYLQSRYYDPFIGRYLNYDTFVSTDVDGILDFNMFAYCKNNPVNKNDTSGLVPAAVIGGAIAGGIVGAISYLGDHSTDATWLGLGVAVGVGVVSGALLSLEATWRAIGAIVTGVYVYATTDGTTGERLAYSTVTSINAFIAGTAAKGFGDWAGKFMQELKMPNVVVNTVFGAIADAVTKAENYTINQSINNQMTFNQNKQSYSDAAKPVVVFIPGYGKVVM